MASQIREMPRVAISSPNTPLIPALDLSLEWTGRLRAIGIEVELLPDIVQEATGSQNIINQLKTRANGILYRAAAVLVACSNGNQSINPDKNVDAHLLAASQAEVPVYLPLPANVPRPPKWPGIIHRVIEIGQNPEEIKQRLGAI